MSQTRTFFAWLDGYLTDKWTGRTHMYYSRVLGWKQHKNYVLTGKWEIPWSEHFGQALVSRGLDFVDKDHCKKALYANPPKGWKEK